MTCFMRNSQSSFACMYIAFGVPRTEVGTSIQWCTEVEVHKSSRDNKQGTCVVIFIVA